MKQIVIRLLAILFVTALIATTNVAAASPYESYTYWSDVSADDKAVYNRSMYEPQFNFSAADIGIGDFKAIQNICVDDNGNLYILDSSSRIILLDNNYKLVREIGLIGGTESYNDANSLYVHDDGTIYICDTLGNRILHSTIQGELIDIILLPDSPLIPDNFDFRPMNLTIDKDGFLYVLSDGSYYGALLYNKNREFLGFYGANTVTTSISGAITNIINRLFSSNAKKAATAQRLPYCFVNIDSDTDGFIYTCNGYTEQYERTGQIRKLSPGTGKNIFESDVNFVDHNINEVYGDGAVSKQDIMDIEVDSNGFIYGLESAFGRIFIYDDSCRILSAFGGGMGVGSQVGTFKNVSGMALKNDGDSVLVSDGTSNNITVFKITNFGKLVKKQITLTLDGDYQAAKEGWQDVLSLDNNFQPAYSGLAQVALDEGDYAKAMEYSKTGYDRDTYGIAFEYWRTNFLDKNFVLLFAVFIALIMGVIALIAISMRKKFVIIKNNELRLMTTAMLHPSNVFTEIKEKKHGSLLLCLITLILYYIVTVLQTLKGGFLFSVYDSESFNSIWVFVGSVGLIVLWIASDWLICTLLGGKGKLKEILIVTCYSLWPLILEKAIRLVLTNVLIPSEASFLGIFDAIAIIYFVIMMIVGLLKIHDFSMTRLIGTTILAIFGIVAIVFLIIMLVILIQQLIGFIITLGSEVLMI